MDRLNHTFKNNVKIMKSQVTKYAVYGVIIAVVALVLATLMGERSPNLLCLNVETSKCAKKTIGWGWRINTCRQ